jgi:hypothetical protein
MEHDVAELSPVLSLYQKVRQASYSDITIDLSVKLMANGLLMSLTSVKKSACWLEPQLSRFVSTFEAKMLSV